MTILKSISLWILLVALILTGCSAAKRFQKDLENSSIQTDYFQGISVVEAQTGKKIIDVQGNKYFTPASNVKIFTLYASQRFLGDSVPSFNYRISGDSLIVRGAADPMFFNDTLHNRSLNFLKNNSFKIYLVDEKLDDQVYGPGWSWEDFEMDFMPEKSVMPLYGNRVQIAGKTDQLIVVPRLFQERVSVVDHLNAGRDKDNNDFYVKKTQGELIKNIPFKTSNQLTADLLGEELGVKVTLLSETDDKAFKPFYEVSYDALYEKMMKESDNFIAEQLLLQVARKVTGSYNSKKAIAFVLDSCLTGIPQKPRWVDGSGLSRYNLMTPQSIVYLLRRMYREIPHERLFSYFAFGGEEGTLKNNYSGMPYIRAKSGTLSNNYCLSGYLTTKKGKVLVFSIMNNHYQGSSTARKTEIARLLKRLYEEL